VITQLPEPAMAQRYYSWLAAFIMRAVVPFPTVVRSGDQVLACSRSEEQCALSCIAPRCMRS